MTPNCAGKHHPAFGSCATRSPTAPGRRGGVDPVTLLRNRPVTKRGVRPMHSPLPPEPSGGLAETGTR